MVDKKEIKSEVLTRAKHYKELYTSKYTLAEIGAMEDPPISRERVRQVLAVLGVTGKDGAASKRAQKRRDEIEKHREAKKDNHCQRVYGCTRKEFVSITGNTRSSNESSKIVKMYAMHRSNAKRLGIPWEMNLVDYNNIVGDRLNHIGLKKNGLVLSRKDKTKGYTRDNCQLLTLSENSRRTHDGRKKNK